jgi:hypothetical protein
MASDKETMVQCELHAGDRIHTAWIPKRFAVKGKRLIIDTMPGDWTVFATYATMELSEAHERSQDYAKHRDFSDA